MREDKLIEDIKLDIVTHTDGLISLDDCAEHIAESLQSKIIVDNFELPIEVTIGNGTFGKGVKLSTVIKRLERQFEYNKPSPPTNKG